jgi:O-antigen ligase
MGRTVLCLIFVFIMVWANYKRPYLFVAFLLGSFILPFRYIEVMPMFSLYKAVLVLNFILCLLFRRRYNKSLVLYVFSVLFFLAALSLVSVLNSSISDFLVFRTMPGLFIVFFISCLTISEEYEIAHNLLIIAVLVFISSLLGHIHNFEIPIFYQLAVKTGLIVENIERVAGAVKNANEFASHCLLLLPINYYFYKRYHVVFTNGINYSENRAKFLRIFNIVSTVLASGTIFISLSRSSILGSLLILVFLIAVERTRIPFRLLIPILLFIMLVYPFVRNHEQFSRLSLKKSERTLVTDETMIKKSEDIRIRLFKKGMAMFKEKPLMGYGPYSFSQNYQDSSTGQLNTHSIYLSAMSETGLLGMSLLMVVLIYPFLKIIRNLKKDLGKLAFAIFVAMFGLVFSTHGNLYSQYMWCMLGIITCISSIISKPQVLGQVFDRVPEPKPVSTSFNVVSKPPYDYYPSYENLRDISE